MDKKTIILTIVIVLVVAGGLSLLLLLPESEENVAQAQCTTTDMIFYYRDGCSWCSKVKSDGSIEQLQEMGINVQSIETTTGQVNHDLQGVPTFVVDNQLYPGYKTLAQLKTLLGCTE